MEIRSNCPRLHNGVPDSGYHLYYNDESNVWYCFACGYSGRGPNPSGETLHTQHKKNPEIVLHDAQPLAETLCSGSIIGRAAYRYLHSHHLHPLTVASRFRLLAQGQYIVFPVYRKDKLIFWQKRHLLSKEFVNPPVDNKPLFWTHDGEDSEEVVLVESYCNAMRASRYSPAVCTFGKFVSDEAAEEIVHRTKAVRIILDAGETEGALKLSRKLRQCGLKRVSICQIRGAMGLDLCDISDEAVRRLVR